MTIDEAIEQLKGMLPIPEVRAIRGQFEYEKAIQLGIEALEAIRRGRDKPMILSYECLMPLPSETQTNDESAKKG